MHETNGEMSAAVCFGCGKSRVVVGHEIEELIKFANLDGRAPLTLKLHMRSSATVSSVI